ncbi:hypothetical protein L0152_15135 [bacterium]|nr:hypothetical protein [bacterium]
MVRMMPFVIACLIAMLIPFTQSRSSIITGQFHFDGWPAEFDGEVLMPIASNDNSDVFASGFDGKIGRFQFGKADLVIRWVSKPSRSIHPAADCFRANGYKIQDEKLCTDQNNQIWRCFIATRKTERFYIKERILDSKGLAWVDTSSWYWAGTLGKTKGPWWFYTIRSTR